jgi:hypothetical protein
VLWLEDYKLPLPRPPSWWTRKDSLNTDWDFNSLLKDAEERAKEDEDEDPEEMKSLRYNGLLFWN